MRGKTLALTASVLLCACAGPNYGANWQPLVDVRPDQQQRYAMDLPDCQGYATRVMDAQQAAVSGAVVGAIFGALLGAAGGGNSSFNASAAGVGALLGGASSAGAAEGDQRMIIRRCLAGRGYNVLN